MPHPGILWNGADDSVLPADGGKQRILVRREQSVDASPTHIDDPAMAGDNLLQMRLLDSPESYSTDAD
jgi:hypothetical protein